MEKQMVPLYLVAHVGFSQDKSFMAMADIASAHWNESDAVEQATYDQLGEFVYEGKPYKRESMVYKLQVEKSNIDQAYVVWSTAKALDGTGRFASRIVSVFLDEHEAQTLLDTLINGHAQIQGCAFQVANHMSKVNVR